MKRHYRDYTDKDIANTVGKVTSMSGLLKALGLRPAGGNFINMRRRLQELKLTCNHWTGQGWNKGKQLKDWSKYTKIEHLKLHVIKLRGHKCESCKLKLWLHKPIALEVHHKDGNRTNNNLINLQLLCPNCHSTTSYYRNRKLSAPTEK